MSNVLLTYFYLHTSHGAYLVDCPFLRKHNSNLTDILSTFSYCAQSRKKLVTLVIIRMNETRALAYLNNITVRREYQFFSHVSHQDSSDGLFGISSSSRACIGHAHIRLSVFYASIQANRGTACARCSQASRKKKKKKTHDSMRSQRKCKFTSTVAGGMHPAGSKNSPRRYCSLVACPTYSRLVSLKRRIPRFTDTIPGCCLRLLSLLLKRKDIGFADRYFCGNRMRKRCLIRKRVSISARDTSYFFRPFARRKFTTDEGHVCIIFLNILANL